jgi:2-C-methyl-D-erythritol 4-phosphate cytidylyltransferase
LAYFALLPAAGSGSRLAGERPKQYQPIAGRPMLWHSIRAVACDPVELVFVVLSPGDEAFARADWSAFGDRVQPLYCGGATRAESVHNGLLAAMDVVDPGDWMLVHDAARPCLPASDLAALIEACRDDPVGGILAVPAADTVKRAATEAGVPRILATEDRSTLWLAQTPQMFRAGLLAEALRGADVSGLTDEASAVERLGHRPRLVAGSRDNLKVTWFEDLAIAEAILGRQGGGR